MGGADSLRSRESAAASGLARYRRISRWRCDRSQCRRLQGGVVSGLEAVTAPRSLNTCAPQRGEFNEPKESRTIAHQPSVALVAFSDSSAARYCDRGRLRDSRTLRGDDLPVHAFELHSRVGPSLPASVLADGLDRYVNHISLRAHQLSGCVLPCAPRASAMETQHAGAHGDPFLDELPDSNLRMDIAAQKRRSDQLCTGDHWIDWCSSEAALFRFRRARWPGIWRTSLHDIADLCSARSIGHSFVGSSTGSGGQPVLTFTRVTLPLSRAGLIAGVVLVFIPSLGAFITPDLLGGAKSVMIGNLIQNQFAQLNQPFGSALSLILTVAV